MVRAVVVVAVVALSAPPALAEEELAAVDKAAPVFRLPVYNQREVGVASLGIDRYVGREAPDKQAKVVVVSFMASFCAPCKKELPYLQQLHARYRDRGLRILMVAIDKEEEGQKKVAELIAQHQLTFPVLKDRFNIVARRWLGSQSPLPSLFLVTPDGVVRTVHRGYSADVSELLEKEVADALKR